MPDPRLAAGIREKRRVEQWNQGSLDGFGRSVWLNSEHCAKDSVSFGGDVALNGLGSEFTRDGSDEVARELGAARDPLVLRERIHGAFDDSREMQGEAIAGFGASKAFDLRDAAVALFRELAFERVVDQSLV